MSVDYYGCEHCGDGVYEEYIGSCSRCGKRICTNCLVNANEIDSRYAFHYNVKYDGTREQKEEYGIEDASESKYGYNVGEIIDDVGIDSKYCPYCSGGSIDENELIEFAAKLLGLSRNKLEEKYLKSL